MAHTTITMRVVRAFVVVAVVAGVPLLAGAQGAKTSSGKSAQAPRITRVQYDYGDAPRVVFSTLFNQNGIRHFAPHGVVFGTGVTRELDARTRPVTSADDMDVDDAMLRVGMNGAVLVWVSAERANQTAYINVAIDRNANGRIESNEWRVRNQRIVIRQRAARQEVALQGLGARDVMGHWTRLTITKTPIPNYNGTGLRNNGETEDWLLPMLPTEPPVTPPPGTPTTNPPIPGGYGEGVPPAGAGQAPAAGAQGGGVVPPFGSLGKDAQNAIKK